MNAELEAALVLFRSPDPFYQRLGLLAVLNYLTGSVEDFDGFGEDMSGAGIAELLRQASSITKIQVGEILQVYEANSSECRSSKTASRSRKASPRQPSS